MCKKLKKKVLWWPTREQSSLDLGNNYFPKTVLTQSPRNRTKWLFISLFLHSGLCLFRVLLATRNEKIALRFARVCCVKKPKVYANRSASPHQKSKFSGLCLWAVFFGLKTPNGPAPLQFAPVWWNAKELKAMQTVVHFPHCETKKTAQRQSPRILMKWHSNFDKKNSKKRKYLKKKQFCWKHRKWRIA